MSDIDKAIQERSQGEWARQLKDNPVLQNAIDTMRASCHHNIENTKFNQQEERDEAWRKLQTIKAFETYIQNVITTGKLAEERISLLQKAKNTAKRVMG